MVVSMKHQNLEDNLMYHTSERIIKNKVGLLNLAEELGNISKACKVMGFSRETFYRYQRAVDEGGVNSLIEKSRKQPNVKNRVDEVIEAAVREIAIENPAFGQLRASNELRKRGIFVSPSGIRSIWLRLSLATMKQRLRALEKKSAEEGIVLTESQIMALEPVQNLFSSNAKNASTTICKLVLIFLSQFFHKRRHFSSQAKERSTTQRFGSTTNLCNSFRLTTSTFELMIPCTLDANFSPL